MDTLIYFVTVVPAGLAFLAAAWRYDHTHVGVGENFMPTVEDLKDFI